MASMTATVEVWVRKGGKGSQIQADGSDRRIAEEEREEGEDVR